jgi:osmotically inducible protein OsmC
LVRVVEDLMPTFERTAVVEWEGSVQEGQGVVRAGTGAFALPVSLPARVGDPGGRTSPEELLAAAHAACYAMAVNATLGRKNARAARTHVTATVTADRSEAGIKIVSSALTVRVEGLEGIGTADFPAVAQEAESRCPVSNALRPSVRIDLRAEAR